MTGIEGNETRERILDAAFAVLHRDGVKKFTQPEVAKVAGIRQSHLTYYFPRKIDLVTAVVDRFLRTAAERFGPGGDQEGAAAVIAAISRLVTDPVHMRVFLALIVEADQEPALREVLSRHIGEFEGLVAARLGRLPGDESISLLLDILRGRGMTRLLSGGGERDDSEELARRLGFGVRRSRRGP